MTTFDKREDSFEKKFALDEELLFKATARRNKLLGLWAAEKLGLYGADAEAYAKAVVIAEWRRKPATRTCSARSAPTSTPSPSPSPTNRFAARWTN